MKQREVTILGQTYRLGCPDDGEIALMEAVGSVDREMSAIRNSGKVKARERMAVLAALNLAYALADRTTAQNSGNTSDVDIDALIWRIDQALGTNGPSL